MECAEEASQPNFMSIKLTHRTQSSSDDFWSVNGDDFFIDNLLNFPTDTGFVEDNNNSYLDDSIPVNEDKTCIPETELRLPVNDIHWASQFVNDSFSGDSSLTFPVKKFRETETVTETVTLVAVNPTFKKMVNKRPRSKRKRNGSNLWSMESSTSSSSVVSVSSCSSKVLSGAEGILGKSSAYMQKRKRAAGTSQPEPWCCSHCGVQKTPQWRAGPLGPKTLCNACGVRFKSGRLLPEYRPACSPTYSSEVHSNSHRKVLEMRRKKVEAGLAIPDHGSCI